MRSRRSSAGVVEVTAEASRHLGAFGPAWGLEAAGEIAGKAPARGLRIHIDGERVERVVVTSRSVDALAYRAIGGGKGNTAYVRGAWAEEGEGRRVVAVAVRSLVARMAEGEPVVLVLGGRGESEGAERLAAAAGLEAVAIATVPGGRTSWLEALRGHLAARRGHGR